MTTIVWVHGFPLSSVVFEKQRGVPDVNHVMPDLPGFGGTPARGAMSMDDYARFIVQELDARGIEKATFAGISMGGYICFAALRLFPERFDGLILIDTRETADTPEGRQGRYDAIEKVRAQGSIAPVVESMHPKMLMPSAPRAMQERVREIMMTSSVEGTISALKAMAERVDSSPMLPKISVPTLIIVGEHDAITPPSDAERMAKAIPNARLVRIADAAHLSNFEQSERFNEALAVLR